MANMIVSGAGSTELNGTYIETGTLNGKYYYEYDVYRISWDGNMWVIGSIAQIFYISQDDVSTPDLCTTWDVMGGISPAPTVTKGATGIPKQFLHYTRMRGN